MSNIDIDPNGAYWSADISPGILEHHLRRYAMSMVRVVPYHVKVKPEEGTLIVDCTSHGGKWSDLSPFNVGPCPMYGGLEAVKMENAWQFSKVYEGQVDAAGYPTQEWWEWAIKGWADQRAHRYPMGKGAKALYSYWDGEKLSYVEARKTIYGPLYIEAVCKTKSYADLWRAREDGKRIVLRDFDGYDHHAKGMSLTQVLNEPEKKMGHAFYLAMMLTSDPALNELGSIPASKY